MAKARTSAGTHAPTATLGELALPGERGFGLNTLRAGDLTVLPGGLPITVDGAVVGAIGVSSGTVIEDAEIAGEAVTRFLNGQTAVDDS